MSKAPVIPQEGVETPSRGRGANAASGEPSNRAREANAAPSRPPGTRRGRHASERQAVQAALHDGAGTSASAMAAHGGHDRHVKIQLPSEKGGVQYPGGRQDRADRGQDHPTGHGGEGVTDQPTATAARSKPYYVPPSRTRPEQPPPYAARPSGPAFEQPPVYGSYPPEDVQEERVATTPPPNLGGPSIPDKKIRRKASFLGFGKPAPRPVAHPHPPPGQAALPVGEDSLPAPPGAGGDDLTRTKTIERVSTLPVDEEAPPGGGGGAAAPGIGVPHPNTIERVTLTTVGESLPTAARPPTAAGSKPYYVPPSRTRPEQPPPYAARPSRPAFEQPPVYGSYPLGDVQEERVATTPPPDLGGPSIPDKKIRRKASFLGFGKPAPRPVAHPHPLPPGQAALPVGEDSLPAPPGAGGDGLTRTKTIERVSTLPVDEEAPPGGGGGAAAPGIGVPHPNTIERITLTTVGESLPTAARDHDKYPPYQPTERQNGKYPSYSYKHPHQPETEPEPYPRTTAPSSAAGPSPWKNNGRTGTDRQSPWLFPADKRKKRRPLAFCFTLCCILFWLLVVGLGVAILVIYLLYHPQPPRLRVTTATLNAGYIDQLPPPRGGLALNSDLYALATIYNPNTKVDVVMRYMELDLYFRGVMIGTTAVWPIHEDPGESVLRNVHLVVSEVRVSREDADAWHNATTRYGLVELKLKARFHVQLNFGRWLPFRFWVYPSCSLWLDPPPGGALRRARCRKSD